MKLTVAAFLLLTSLALHIPRELSDVSIPDKSSLTSGNVNIKGNFERETISRETISRDTTSRDTTSRDTTSRDTTSRDTTSKQFIKLGFSQQHDLLDKRGEYEYFPLRRRSSMYIINFLVGSNKQNVSVMLDTGSADLWLPLSSINCVHDCDYFGSYNHNTSTSYVSQNTTFNISYVDGTGSTGTYVKDDLYLTDNAKLEQFQFGDVNSTTLDYGVMGIGLNTSEAILFNDRNNTSLIYPNFPMALKEQGLVDRSSYSLYLSSPEATEGSVLFGAVDVEKFDGFLTTLPVVTRRLAVKSTYINVGNASINTGYGLALDSGYTFTQLPEEDLKSIATQFNGTYSLRSQAYEIACDQPDDKFIEFKFDQGASFKVPYSSLLFKTADYCLLGIIKSGDRDSLNNPPTLGVNALRHAYVYYDLDDKTISIAQAKFTNSSNIVAMSQGIGRLHSD